MKRKIPVVMLVAALGCGSKKSEPAPGSGSAPAGSSAPAPMQRYSELPGSALPALELPDDPKRKEKIALGHALFFDKRLSGNADLSCYSCHQNEDGNGGHDPIAIGSGKKTLTRHSPVIWNVGMWKGAYYWDGRAKTLEDNVTGAWGGGNMGAGADTPEATGPKLDAHAAKMAGLPEYKKQFEAAFGKTPAKAEHVSGAIAEYMRTMVCNDTAYDKFVAGDKAALTEQQIRGLDLFGGKAACTLCHNPPQFSNAMTIEGGVYYNIGIGTGGPEDKVDVGRMKVTNQPTDWPHSSRPACATSARARRIPRRLRLAGGGRQDHVDRRHRQQEQDPAARGPQAERRRARRHRRVPPGPRLWRQARAARRAREEVTAARSEQPRVSCGRWRGCLLE